MTTSWWWKPTAALDATRNGGQSYDRLAAREVMDALQRADYQHPVRVADIALQTGVPGRTVRQIVQDIDARVCLIGKRPSGLLVCRYAEEGRSLTSMINAASHTSHQRVRERRAFESHMEHRQMPLFDDGDLLYDEDLDDDDA